MIAPAPTAPLDYAPRSRTRLRRRAWRVGAVLMLAGFLGALAWHRTILLFEARRAYYQHRCLRYTAPPDQIVYDEDENRPSPLLNAPGYIGVAPVIRLKVNGPLARTIAMRPAPPLADFTSLYPKYSFPGATLFLHELRSKSGLRRLVVVTRVPQIQVPFLYALGLTADVFEPSGWRTPPVPIPELPIAYSWLSDMKDPPTKGLRFYAGQPDPADPAHFTIRYDLLGGSGTIDGRLTDDGKRIALQIRDGPAIGTKWQTDVLFK
jgi:hypothetical protein